jgi:hypothetical protein
LTSTGKYLHLDTFDDLMADGGPDLLRTLYDLTDDEIVEVLPWSAVQPCRSCGKWFNIYSSSQSERALHA